MTFLCPSGAYPGGTLEWRTQMTGTEFVAHVVKLLAEQELPFPVLSAMPERRVVRPTADADQEAALAHRAAFKSYLQELLEGEPRPISGDALALLCIRAGEVLAGEDTDRLRVAFDIREALGESLNVTRETIEYLTTLAETAHFGALETEPATVTVSTEEYHGELVEKLGKMWQAKPADQQVHSARIVGGRIVLLRNLLPKELVYVDQPELDLGMTFDERFILALYTYRRMLRTYMQE